MTFSYSDLVLGLCVNAETYDVAEVPSPEDKLSDDRKPFDVSVLGNYDFCLRPSNFSCQFHTEPPSLFKLESIRTWYGGNTLVKGVDQSDYVHKGLHFEPYVKMPEGEPVLRHPPTSAEDYQDKLAVLDAHGIQMRPVQVDGDGSCLVHAVSTAMVGSQIYYDALRFAIYAELRDHPTHYTETGVITEAVRERFLKRLDAAAKQARELGLEIRAGSMEEASAELRKFDNSIARRKWSQQAYDEALEKSRPSEGELLKEDRYLEEIHVSALANLLRRPIFVLAAGLQGGLFLPLRHDPEECRLEDGRPSPPLVIFQSFDHYTPFCLQPPAKFWEWAEQTFEGDEKIIQALRGYEVVKNILHRIPEWVEEILLYVVYCAASKLEELLSLYEMPDTERDLCRAAFGRPHALESLPSAFIFQESVAGRVECRESLRNIEPMNNIFTALGMQVHTTHVNSHNMRLSVAIPELDFEKIKNVTWALYWLMSVPQNMLQDGPAGGVLPSAGNVDRDLFQFVLNFTGTDEINLGVARLYCAPEGWDFRPMLSPIRDPRQFLTVELSRLIQRFERLTELPFESTVQADLVQMHAAATHMAMGLPGETPVDVRNKLPRALLAMQRVIRRCPYPGRGRLMPLQVVLERYAGEQPITLADVSVATREERRTLLAALVGRYGLPLGPQFEAAACTVLLYERYTAARARLTVVDWVVECVTARPLHNALIERLRPNAVIRRIRLSPLASSSPLPSYALLFPPTPTTHGHAEAHSLVVEPRPVSPASVDSDSFVLVAPMSVTPQSLDPPLFSLFRSTSHTGSPMLTRTHTHTHANDAWDGACAGKRGGGAGGEEEEEDLGFAMVKRNMTSPF